MDSKKNYQLVGGILLILLGATIFLVRIIPIPNYWSGFFTGWPMILIGIGLGLFVLGLLFGTPDMVVPASIVAGLGGIFLYQNSTQDWESWSYLWSLIPGFVGIGLILSGLIKWRLKDEVREGFRLIIISAVLFSIFGAIFGRIQALGQFWPVILIVLGLWIIISNTLKR